MTTRLSSLAPVSALLLALLLPTGAAAQQPEGEPDLVALLTSVDENAREQASHTRIQMQVQTRRYDRTIEMEAWSMGEERTLIRVHAPARDRGTTTLQVDDNLWTYVPNLDRTIRVPANMMSGAWMGSHLTNNDLVRQVQLVEDFEYQWLRDRQPAQPDAWVIECIPKPETPVAWGRVEVTVRADGVPLQQDFFDEEGELVRTLEYSDIQQIDGEQVALRMRVVPHNKPGESTTLQFLELDLSPELSEEMFSLQALTQ